MIFLEIWWTPWKRWLMIFDDIFVAFEWLWEIWVIELNMKTYIRNNLIFNCLNLRFRAIWPATISEVFDNERWQLFQFHLKRRIWELVPFNQSANFRSWTACLWKITLSSQNWTIFFKFYHSLWWGINEPGRASIEARWWLNKFQHARSRVEQDKNELTRIQIIVYFAHTFCSACFPTSVACVSR
jgi:hypothetical protein